METITLALLLVLLTILTHLYRVIKKKSSYWTNMGLKQNSPWAAAIEGLKDPSFNGITKLHNQYPNERFVGTYVLLRPNLLVRDPVFIEKMFVKDFQYFMDHDSYKEDNGTMINLGLFTLTGNEWRSMRHKLLPTFTTGKLKLMFDQTSLCADEFVKTISKQRSDNFLRDGIKEYTLDVASTVIFGIEIKNEKLRAEFKKNSSEMFESSMTMMIMFMVAQQFPSLEKYVKLLSDKAEKFFKSIINDTFEQRMKSKVQRNDYVQLLLKLKEQGSIEMKTKDPDDNYLNQDVAPISEHYEMTDDLLAAQAFQFLTAGFDPMVNTILFAFYEIARNSDIQEKVRKEIHECLEEDGGYSYKSLRSMTYLDQCIQETLRLYPVIPFLNRYCVKDYKVDDSLTIEKETPIMISILGIQRDPKYYPDPEKFDPDRFHPDAQRVNYTYLPFGDGPRMCIGMRFAMMEIKLALAKAIESYSLEISPKTDSPLKINTKNFFLCPENVYFNLTKL